jgi:hypothetical protein
MAHFAKLNNENKVLEVNVVSNAALDPANEEASGIAFLTEWSGGHTNWKQTSYNHNFRKQYAGIGFTYDSVNDVFIAPQPYFSWTLDDNFDWQPPSPKPASGLWIWNEEDLEWVEIPVSE